MGFCQVCKSCGTDIEAALQIAAGLFANDTRLLQGREKRHFCSCVVRMMYCLAQLRGKAIRMMPVSCGQNAVLGSFHFEFSEGGKWGRVRSSPALKGNSGFTQRGCHVVCSTLLPKLSTSESHASKRLKGRFSTDDRRKRGE